MDPYSVNVVGFENSMGKVDLEQMILELFSTECVLMSVNAERVHDSGIPPHWRVKVSTLLENGPDKLVRKFNNYSFDGRNRLKLEKVHSQITCQLLRSAEPQSTLMFNEYCCLHCGSVEPKNFDVGYLLVKFPTMKYFEDAVCMILSSHPGNCFPLRSFLGCYRAVMKAEVPVDSTNGIQLEYLISSLPDIEIIKNRKGVKLITRSGSPIRSQRSQPLLPSMRSFGHELCQILLNSDHSQIPLHKIVSAYQESKSSPIAFSASDYGEKSLKDMLFRLANMCLIMGEDIIVNASGETLERMKMVTVQPNIHRRRFIQVVLKLLGRGTNATTQSPASPQVIAFREVKRMLTDHNHKPTDFGAFCFDELLGLVSTSREISNQFDLREEDGSLLLKPTTISTFSKEQRNIMVGFTLDVQYMLRLWPNCSIPFHQFIPFYHHTTKEQCKVHAYGFTKLEDLFNSMTDSIVLYRDEHNVRSIRLTTEAMICVLRDNVHKVFTAIKPIHTLPINEFEANYAKIIGIPMIDHTLVGFASQAHMLASISPETISVITNDLDGVPTAFLEGSMKSLNDTSTFIRLNYRKYEAAAQLKANLLKRLLKTGRLEAADQNVPKGLEKYYRKGQITSMGRFARIALFVLQKLNIKVANLAMFETVFHKMFGIRLKPQEYGSLFTDRLFTFIEEIVKVQDNRAPKSKGTANYSKENLNRQAFLIEIKDEFAELFMDEHSLTI